MQERVEILETIKAHRKNKDLILITGLRRIGKSEILNSIIQFLRIERPPVKIVFIRGDELNYHRQNLLPEARALGVGPSAIIIDNADLISDFKESLSEIQRKHNPWIVLSEKKANSLAKKLKPVFSPKIITLPPLSYKEYLNYFNLKNEIESLDNYIINGGIPENLIFTKNGKTSNRIKTLYLHSILLTEILEYGKIQNAEILKLIFEILVLNTGKNLSSRAICKELSKHKISISPTSALEYLSELKRSKIIIEAQLYDISEKKLVDSNLHYYCADTGLRTAISNLQILNSDDLKEKSLENLIFLHLYYKYPKVYKGRVNINSTKKEQISFICESKKGRTYYQFAGKNPTRHQYQQKRKALLSIKDGWKKVLITDDAKGIDQDGILTISPKDLLFGK